MGLLGGFGILGLIVFIWVLFGKNGSKSVEAIAASLRVRAHVKLGNPIDLTHAQYLKIWPRPHLRWARFWTR
ncbi:MAG: hypothetical protein Q4P24_04925 [Rhodobacterales bacterium]|nr:hypothetical protein [Rhodobacterales bacterium]